MKRNYILMTQTHLVILKRVNGQFVSLVGIKAESGKKFKYLFLNHCVVCIER